MPADSKKRFYISKLIATAVVTIWNFFLNYFITFAKQITLKLFDSHTHSQFSPDSRMTIISAAQTAIKQGLGGIIFTDHYDVDPPKGIVAFDFDPAEQQLEIEKIKGSFGNFEILKGIEVGIQLKSLPKINRFLDRFSFDTIIASAHFVEGMDPYFGDYYKNRDWREAYGFYLKSIYDCIVQFDNFDVMYLDAA